MDAHSVQPCVQSGAVFVNSTYALLPKEYVAMPLMTMTINNQSIFELRYSRVKGHRVKLKSGSESFNWQMVDL